MKNIFYIIIYICLTQICNGQESYILSGKVVDEELLVLPRVELQVGDSVVAVTDATGDFKIIINHDVRKITFRGLGLEETPIILNPGCSKLEVIMLNSSTYCFVKPKKVERLRRKRFENIKILYNKAYKKGIFKSNNPCGNIEFVTWLN